MQIPAFLTRNVRLKALATSLALVTWVAVVYSGNPPETRTIAVHVPQDARAIPAEYVLLHPIGDVSVRINGTRNHLADFKFESLSVTASFGAIKNPGTAAIPITVVNHDSNVELDSVPTTVSADVDRLVSATKTVQLVMNPPPPRGYLAQGAVASPSEVVVTGPSHEVDALTALVSLDMSQQKTNLSEQSAIVLEINGKRINDVGVSPPTVQVGATVKQSATSRGSAVLPRTTGSVTAGRELAGISVDPPTVALSGSQDVLNSLDSVPTVPIDLAGISGDRSVSVKLLLPAGVTAIPDTVTVRIQVQAVAAPGSSANPSPSPSAPH